MKRASALELLAHRVLWSLVVCVILLLTVVPRGWWSRIGHRRSLIMLGAARPRWSRSTGASTSGRSTTGTWWRPRSGYYINPILSILVGVILLRERLAPLQWASVGLAAAAVVVLTIDYGRLPWIALTLAASFATYGLLKKQVNGGAVETLTVESALLTPVALGYLIFLQSAGTLTFGHLGWSHTPAADGHRPGHGGAAALLRRRRHPAAAEHPRAAAVPGARPCSSCSACSTSARPCPSAAGSASPWSGSRW